MTIGDRATNGTGFWWLGLAALVIGWGSIPTTLEAGKLGSASSAARGDSSSSSDSDDDDDDRGRLSRVRRAARGRRTGGHGHHEHDAHHHGHGWWSGLLLVGPSPNREPSWDSDWFFLEYPYENDFDGFLTTDPEISMRLWSTRTSIEWGSDFDGLDRIGFGLLLEHAEGSGIEVSWNGYYEDLSGGGTDQLDIGDINLLIPIGVSEKARLRSGIGANWMSDLEGTEGGINLTLKGDWYPSRPWVISSEFDIGTLGEATILHARVSTGVACKRFELFGGYDWRRVGNANLDGVMFGVQFRF
jgi:hypothetical protein